jgi:predicted permease
MTRWLARLAVRMLPARTRARYGQELVALLDCSPRRLADTLDVLLLAAHAHLEDPMRRPLHTFANVSLAVSLVLLGYTVNDLSTGLTELPQHWWSSVAALSVIASGAAVLLTRHRPATSSSAIR